MHCCLSKTGTLLAGFLYVSALPRKCHPGRGRHVCMHRTPPPPHTHMLLLVFEQAAGAAAGVAAEQAQLHVKERGDVPDQGPPTETLAMVVETVLSRQGRVDLIISCPVGEALLLLLLMCCCSCCCVQQLLLPTVVLPAPVVLALRHSTVQAARFEFKSVRARWACHTQ
jgi:hypothetical protein